MEYCLPAWRIAVIGKIAVKIILFSLDILPIMWYNDIENSARGDFYELYVCE